MRKLIKHTQTIRRQLVNEFFECGHFVGLSLEGLKTYSNYLQWFMKSWVYESK